MLTGLKELLLPQRCVLCHGRGQAALALCQPCQTELPWLEKTCPRCASMLPNDTPNASICGSCSQTPPYFDQTRALFEYKDPLDQLISAIKFQQQLKVAKLLGTLMAHSLKKINQQKLPQALIPMPLHAKRLQQRGFNQAIELGRVIAQALHLPLLRSACERIRYTEPQAKIKAKNRRKNISGAFKVKLRQKLTHVAIIDDVMTTGSTCNELAKILKKEGIVHVEIWCCCRTRYQ